MKVPVGISNKHIHLSKEIYEILFKDEELVKIKNLNQPGQFASDKKLTIKTAKSTIENVRVLGPLRTYTQVELAKTDAMKLGINPPVRDSGDLAGSETVTLVSEHGEITLEECCIIATRHIHISPKELKEFNLDHSKTYKIKVDGEKGGILDNVELKVAENSFFEMHIDTDDGNAFLIKQGSLLELLEEE